MMTIYIDGHACLYEVQALCMLFLGGEKIRMEQGGVPPLAERYIYTGAQENPGSHESALTVRVLMNGRLLEEMASASGKDARERIFGRMLYRILQNLTGITPPWGILTGVRPVRLFLDRMERGGTEKDILRYFRESLLVSPEKARLAYETAAVQRPILARHEANRFMLYISIPFCPTRCRYCSFVSHSISQAARLVPAYVELLCREIGELGAMAARLGLEANAVYFGGGTPTALTAAQLSAVMDAIASGVPFVPGTEYTVEAGRPDTITPEKLEALRRAGADRISINPQTMRDDVLRLAGRPHTAADVRGAFTLARRYGFHCINMDLIAGLDGDSPEGFRDTLEQVLDLGPQNITVHTLSVKRAADLAGAREEVLAARPASHVGAMLREADRLFHQAGYRPYYLYRQKNTVENLENTGYCLPGYENIYNIRIMDESASVLAAGAGGVTKLVRPAAPESREAQNGRKYELRRIFNYKYPYEYINRFDQLRARRAEMERFLTAGASDGLK